jgi:hypothetical protein
MDVTLPAATVFYRVVGPGRRWSDVLAGLGAFFGSASGSRYTTLLQKAVYLSTDPIVALTEYAYYEGRRWQAIVGQTALVHQKGLVPFCTQPGKRPRLWAFRLNAPPTIADVAGNAALQAFGLPPFILFNPSNDFYRPTQELTIRVYSHNPAAGAARFQGVQAPSVRTPQFAGGGQPVQQVFLLGPKQTRIQGAPAASWDVDIEFLDLATQGSVTAGTSVVEWARPRVRLHPRAGAGGLPGSPCKPAGMAAGAWERLNVNRV